MTAIPTGAVAVRAYDANDKAFDRNEQPPTFEAWFLRGDHSMCGVNLFVPLAVADGFVRTEREAAGDIEQWLTDCVFYGYEAEDGSPWVYMVDCTFALADGSLSDYDEDAEGKAWFGRLLERAER